MRRTTLLVVAGVAAFLLFLVAFLPATLLLRFLPPEVTLDGVAGTVWKGSAADLRFRGRSLGGLAWTNRPWRLAALELDYAATLNHDAGGPVTTDVRISKPGEIVLENLRGGFPVGLVQGLVSPAGWNGQVDLDVSRLELENGFPVAAEGRVVARDLTSPPPRSMDIGSFELVLGAGSVGGDGISGRLQDLGSGLMRVRATLDLKRDRTYTITGEVAAGPEADEAVRKALAFLGPPDSLGRRPLSIEGSL